MAAGALRTGVPQGALAKRTPTVDSGSDRRRTTDWRSVTCSIRPTNPPEVITGMPTMIPLRLPWLIVTVWSKLDGAPEMTSARTRAMPDRVGSPRSDFELLVLVDDGLGRDGGTVLRLDAVAQLVVLVLEVVVVRDAVPGVLHRRGHQPSQAAQRGGERDEAGAHAVHDAVAALVERQQHQRGDDEQDEETATAD